MAAAVLASLVTVGCGGPPASLTPPKSAAHSAMSHSDPAEESPSGRPLNQGLLLTEAKPRDPEFPGCSTQGEFKVKLVVDTSGGSDEIIGVALDPSQFPGYPNGFPAIIWPFGFSADPGPPAVVLDPSGSEVAIEDGIVRFAGGTVDDTGYHVCLVNGVNYAAEP